MRYNSKWNKSTTTSNFTYYNCGKQGYIKIECLNFNKDKSVDKKHEHKLKEKCAYISWKDNKVAHHKKKSNKIMGTMYQLVSFFSPCVCYSCSAAIVAWLSSKDVHKFFFFIYKIS